VQFIKKYKLLKIIKKKMETRRL